MITSINPATPIIAQNSNEVIFDADDIDYLIRNLSEAQLKHERYNHNIQWARDINRDYPGYSIEDGEYWLDCSRAINMALDIIRTNKPQPKQSPNRPRIDVEAVKQRVDIINIVECYTHLYKAGRLFRGNCPLHSEKSPSFTVYPESQSWHCFGACNIGGDVVSFIQRVEHTDFKGAISILEGM